MHGEVILNVQETVVVESKTELVNVTTLPLNMAVKHVVDPDQKFEPVILKPAQVCFKIPF